MLLSLLYGGPFTFPSYVSSWSSQTGNTSLSSLFLSCFVGESGWRSLLISYLEFDSFYLRIVPSVACSPLHSGHCVGTSSGKGSPPPPAAMSVTGWASLFQKPIVGMHILALNPNYFFQSSYIIHKNNHRNSISGWVSQLSQNLEGSSDEWLGFLTSKYLFKDLSTVYLLGQRWPSLII